MNLHIQEKKEKEIHYTLRPAQVEVKVAYNAGSFRCNAAGSYYNKLMKKDNKRKRGNEKRKRRRGNEKEETEKEMKEK